MKLESQGPLLSTVFVDYDNIYLSLKRKSEEAAARFAKDAGGWLKEIESGRLVTPTNGPAAGERRRIVMNRCYGNPVPRRNSQADNATDMNSFAFVRHHFLRSGFEIVDCPPLTQQLKSSADIRMVMDVLDYLAHDTRFDEFIILSGEADFTPVLHRLRTHARRTIVYSNDYTATPFTAISDGEIREQDLISLLLDGRLPGQSESAAPAKPAITSAQTEQTRRQILAEVTSAVRSAGQPMPLEALAERAVRALGHEKTIGSSWAGAGTFRELLASGLPEPMRLSEQAPFLVFEAPARQIEAEPGAGESRAVRAATQMVSAAAMEAQRQASLGFSPIAAPPSAAEHQPSPVRSNPRGNAPPGDFSPPSSQRPNPSRANDNSHAQAIQQSIQRIHEACKAPPLSPPDYRLLFNLMAQEINAHGLNGAQTLANILQRAQDEGAEFKREDVRFVLDVLSEADPWFEQGASADLFAGRFRNFVAARCRSQGLELSMDELDLIEAWFAAPSSPPRKQTGSAPGRGGTASLSQELVVQGSQPAEPRERWWNIEDSRQAARGVTETSRYNGDEGEEFPRIVRSRIRG